MSEPTLGELVDQLQQQREVVRAATKKLDEAKQAKSLLEEKILARMKDENIDRASGKLASVSIKDTTVGQLVDMEKFARYVKRNNAFELFERRISSTAFREHLEQRGGKPPPGTERFVKRSLNLRTRAENQ